MEEDHQLQGGSGIYTRVLRPVVKVKSGKKRGKKRGGRKSGRKSGTCPPGLLLGVCPELCLQAAELLMPVSKEISSV